MQIMELKNLTQAEAHIMMILWRIEKAFIRDIINALPQPIFNYNSIYKVLRVLESKNYIGHQIFGKKNQYYPIINIEEYRRYATEQLFDDYDTKSAKTSFSNFINENKIDLSNTDEVIKMLKKINNKPK